VGCRDGGKKKAKGERGVLFLKSFSLFSSKPFCKRFENNSNKFRI
jgi:hypothetical protein